MTIIRELHTRLSRLTWREKVRNVGNDDRSPIPSAGHYERRLFKKYGTQPIARGSSSHCGSDLRSSKQPFHCERLCREEGNWSKSIWLTPIDQESYDGVSVPDLIQR